MLLRFGFLLLNLNIASSELTLTTYKGITQGNLMALPTFSCKPAENHNAKSLMKYLAKSDPLSRRASYGQYVFIMGYNETSLQLCYIRESYSQIRLSDVNSLKWYARQGRNFL